VGPVGCVSAGGGGAAARRAAGGGAGGFCGALCGDRGSGQRRRHLNSPGRQTTLFYISQRWDRDVGGRGGPERYRRLGDDPPLYAFEPLTHTDWVVSTEPPRHRQRSRFRRRWKISFREAPAIALLWLSPQRTVETTQSVYDTLRRPRGRRVVSEAAISRRSTATSDVAIPTLRYVREWAAAPGTRANKPIKP
jgi:hypothetical protein